MTGGVVRADGSIREKDPHGFSSASKRLGYPNWCSLNTGSMTKSMTKKALEHQREMMKTEPDLMMRIRRFRRIAYLEGKLERLGEAPEARQGRTDAV